MAGVPPRQPPETRANGGSSTGEVVTLLTRLDASKTIIKTAYSRELKKWQSKLYELQLEAHDRGISSILVFEGPDAAGKGGAIRRITAALDARNYQVHAFAAPSDEERAQHYLWRFWRLLERAGRVTQAAFADGHGIPSRRPLTHFQASPHIAFSSR